MRAMSPPACSMPQALRSRRYRIRPDVGLPASTRSKISPVAAT